MKQSEVKIGGIYYVKVSDAVAKVRIDSDRGTRMKYMGLYDRGREVHDGWMGTNLTTGRRIRIRSAQKLRGEVPTPKAKGGVPMRAPFTPVSEVYRPGPDVTGLTEEQKALGLHYTPSHHGPAEVTQVVNGEVLHGSFPEIEDPSGVPNANGQVFTDDTDR